MKSMIRIALFTLLFTGSAAAQDAASGPPITPAPVQSVPEKNANDTVKFGFGFTNAEYEDLFSTEYEQGIYAEVDVKALKRGPVRLGIVGRYDRSRFGSPAIDGYGAGARFSVDTAKGLITLFAHAIFGVTTSYNDDYVTTRTYGAGVDINIFDHLSIRPVEVNWKRFEGPFSPATQSFNVGIVGRW